MTVYINSEGYLEYPAVFISDMHLGKKHSRPDMLYEFLSKLKCQQLFIVGDAIEGWGLMKKNHRKFDEMTLRVMDLLNAMADSGVEITYLPGNHDENLRFHWDNQKLKIRKPKLHKETLFRRSILDHDYTFSDPKTGLSSTFHLTDDLTYIDPQGRRMHVLHGDQFDPRYLRSKWGKILSKVGDAAYDTMIEVNGHVSGAARHILGVDFSFSKMAKKQAKRFFNVAEGFEKALSEVASGKEYDGLVCGHIHTANVADVDGALYVNSGDWVESCTAAMHDEDGNWMTLGWEDAREQLGFSAREFTTEKSPHAYAEYRGVTERQLKWVQRIWPAKDFDKRYELLKDARRDVMDIRRRFEDALDNDKGVKKMRKRLAKARETVEQHAQSLALY